MPISTKHYLLESFLDGDIYSALSDRRRFSTVDNQLWRIAETIGDGRINGWGVTESVFPSIVVGSGNGIIDGFFVETFDDQVYEISPNGIFYVFAQRRVGVIGDEGPKSDIKFVSYTDDGPPLAPSSLSAAATTATSVNLSWTANTENDLSHYEIERYEPGFPFRSIATPAANSYTDTVDEDTSYIYRVYAVDLSGNKSSATEVSVITPLSSLPPSDPMNVSVTVSESGLNVLWDRPLIPSAHLTNYLITWIELNSDDSEKTGTEKYYIEDPAVYYYRINDLVNGQKYKVILQIIDHKGRLSNGIVIKATPQQSPAPRDPETISWTLSDSSDGVEVFLSWENGDSPYDPATSYRYKIYSKLAGSPESVGIDVPIGFMSERISLYTYDLVNYFSIPSNSMMDFRITSIDESGFESNGASIRIFTSSIRQPKRLKNVTSDFDSNTGWLTIKWENQSDTYNIKLEIYADNLEDAYVQHDELFSGYIGLTDKYVYKNGELDKKYTIYLTPYNIDEIAGTASGTVEITVIPDFPLPAPPSQMEIKSSDRSIYIRWNQSETNYTAYYNVYRKEGDVTLTCADWEHVDELPSTILHFEDYGLQNDTTYSYYVTSVDIYGRSSFHLPDNAVNLNFVQAMPKSDGILTSPVNFSVEILPTKETLLTWDSLPEEFDAFAIYRSINNLHGWEKISTINKDVFSYTDMELPLIDGSAYYYMISKTFNDCDIIVQTSSELPENSIYLATVTTGSSSVTEIDVTDRRDILNLQDPLSEHTNSLLLQHKHREAATYDPSRINLSSKLVIDEWATVDGKIWTASEDITGESHVLKVNGHFPDVFYSIDVANQRIMFSEVIATVDEEGEIEGESPSIVLEIFGTEEVDGEIDDERFINLHSRQVKYGQLIKEQIPPISHEGRIRERLIPKRFLLERLSNNQFIIPQGDTDSSKNFGDSTTFFSVEAANGQIEDLFGYDSYDNDTEVGFRNPLYSPDTLLNLLSENSYAGVSDEYAFQGTKSYKLAFTFCDMDSTRWAKISTTDTDISPNPVINLNKRLRFRVKNIKSSFYLTLGIREITATDLAVGYDGGTSGAIEWVNCTDTVTDLFGNIAPIGDRINRDADWIEIDVDLKKAHAINFQNGNGILNQDYGVLEHIAITIDNSDDNPTEIEFYIDKVQQVDDLLVAGTSQGILISNDFGTTWETSRLTTTPVHKFYKSGTNLLWAISANEVLVASDPAYWFVNSGTTGIQYIRDIVEDSHGNIYTSTDKGVYWLDTALLKRFSFFRQTQPIDPLTSDAYALYCNNDEIWVSTEIGIYKSEDFGQTWQYSMDTGGLPVYQLINIGTDESPNIIGCTRKHILRKTLHDTTFEIIADFNDQFEVSNIWKIEYFNNKLYVSTENGVYANEGDTLFEEGSQNIAFKKVFADLNHNGLPGIATTLNTIQTDQDQKLFIGQENKLLTADVNGVVKTRTEFRKKEMPSFFVNNIESTVGFTYNCFNKVLCFREPQPVDSLVSAAYLPRRIYLSENGGWSYTNPAAEVFVYRQDVPSWVDWELNSLDIVDKLQDVSRLISYLPDLDDFNSLVPDSISYRDMVLNDITAITTLDENGDYGVNSESIISFMNDFSKFLSLISDEIKKITNDDGTIEYLTFPQILLTGVSATQRASGSRADILESTGNIVTEDSTNINIDCVTGSVDFTVAYTSATTQENKAKFDFNKFDQLHITIFNSNVSNTGQQTHNEVESSMEDINCGLSSNLARAVHANLIKAGIFLESNHDSVFDTRTSNVQSKFYPASSEWYDVVNSTVDYNLITEVPPSQSSRFVNTVKYLSGDSYSSGYIWAGTDNGILVYSLSSDGNPSLDRIIYPQENCTAVWDIYDYNSDIYSIVENTEINKCYLLLSQDLGETWTQVDTNSVPSRFFTIRIINGNMVIGTSNGVFFCDSIGQWWGCETDPQSDDFGNRIQNIFSENFVIVESNLHFYRSGNGSSYFSNGSLSNNGVNQINKIMRFKNLTYAATNKGLYNDANSILSNNIQFGLEAGLEDDTTLSASVGINDIAALNDALYCCGSNGKIYRYYNSSDEESSNEWRRYKVPDIDVIHKITVAEIGDQQFAYLFSYDQIKVANITPTAGVFEC